MSGDQAQKRPEDYWDRAGVRGYAQAMYPNADVASYLRGRLWETALDIADTLGVLTGGHVLELGCGDGAFANQMLAARYRMVDGLDLSEMAIRRAQAEAKKNATYRAIDLVTFDYGSLPRYDAAFMLGILHHVKPAAPAVIRAVARRTDKMIVLEPNGNNLLRKALEFTPSYRRAGEDSFRSRDLIEIFTAAGWRTVVWRRLNLLPNFAPRFLCRLLAPIERRIEASPLGRALCTVDAYGLTFT